MNEFNRDVIGEQLNYSIFKTAVLIKARDWPALVAPAAAQAEKGASSVDPEPGIQPVGCDMDGSLCRTLDALERMQNDALLARTHKIDTLFKVPIK